MPCGWSQELPVDAQSASNPSHHLSSWTDYRHDRLMTDSFWTFLDISGHESWRLTTCETLWRGHRGFEVPRSIRELHPGSAELCCAALPPPWRLRVRHCSSYSPFIACFQNVFCMSPAFWANGFFKSPALSLSHVCLSENCLNCFNHKFQLVQLF